MKSLLIEAFNVIPKQAEDGRRYLVIQGTNGDNTFPYKDELKKFGARFINVGGTKTWGWYAGKTPESLRKQYDTMVKPCLEYLMKLETESPEGPRDVIKVCDQLLAQIESEDWTPLESVGTEMVQSMSKEEMKSKLADFKTELVRKLGTPEFKALMDQIIQFRRNNGYDFSFLNCIRILLQDPLASVCKSKSHWADPWQRKLKSGGVRACVLFRPNGRRVVNKQNKDSILQSFLQKHNVSSEQELSPGERERLDVALHRVDNSQGFTPYLVYDVRFTEPMDPNNDIWGSTRGSKPEYKWHEYDADTIAQDEMYINAALEVAQSYGVNLVYKTAEDLGSAKGYAATNGDLALDNKAPLNRGFLNTIVHETAHHLLHIAFVSSKNKDLKQFYISSNQQRGLEEQQAELCAWIVLRMLGYEGMDASMNYMGGWGMQAETAVAVFDQVANTANKITDDILKIVNATDETMVQESTFRKLNEHVSGLDVAKLVGMEDLYLQGKEKNYTENNPYDMDIQTENRQIMKSKFFNMLNKLK